MFRRSHHMMRSFLAVLMIEHAMGLQPIRVQSSLACPPYEFGVNSGTASCGAATSFAADPPGSTIRYSTDGLAANTGLSIDVFSGIISGTPTNVAYEANGLNFFVYAWDRTPPTDPFDFTGRSQPVTASWMLSKNTPPEVVGDRAYSCPNYEYSPSNTMAQCATGQKFNDPDGDPLTYSTKGSGFPPGSGLRLDSADGRIYGEPTNVDYTLGQIAVYIVATDSSNAESPLLAVDWKLTNPTDAPTAVPTAIPTATPTATPTVTPTMAPEFDVNSVPNQEPQMCGDTYSFDANLYYVNNANLPNAYELRGTPFGSGLSIDPATGIINGELNRQDALNSPLMLRVINNAAVLEVYLRVDQVKSVESDGYVPDQSWIEGTTYVIDMKDYFKNEDSATQYSIQSSQSRNVVITSTGMLTATPSLSDLPISPFDVVVSATNLGDCGGGTATQTMSVTVSDSNLPPVYSGPDMQVSPYCMGTRYQIQIGRYVTDPEGEAVTYRINGLPLQSGFRWDEQLAEISGRANEYDVKNGPYQVQVVMSDQSARTSMLRFDMTFAEGRVPPQVDPPIPSPVTAFVRERFMGYFNYHFHETRGEPLIYSIHGLPAGSGLGIGPITGIFSGNPNEADLQNSPIPISVFASNEYSPAENGVCPGHGGRARADFLLVVENRLVPPLCMPIPEDNCYAAFNEYYQRDVMRYFRDPNMKGLKFSVRGLPRGSGLSISERGVVSGILSVADLNADPMQLIIVASNDLDVCESVMVLYVSGTAPTPAPMLCAETRPIPPQIAVYDEQFYMRTHVFFPPPPPPQPSPYELMMMAQQGLLDANGGITTIDYPPRLTYTIEGLTSGSGYQLHPTTGVFTGVATYVDIQASRNGGLRLVSSVSCGGAGLPQSVSWVLNIDTTSAGSGGGNGNGNGNGNGGNGNGNGGNGNGNGGGNGGGYGGNGNGNGGGNGGGYGGNGGGYGGNGGGGCVNGCHPSSGGPCKPGVCPEVCNAVGGTARCSCYPGRIPGPAGQCIHVNDPCLITGNCDPCVSNNGGCAQICQNQGGVARCSCVPGQMLANDGRNCVNGGNPGDPCLQNNGGCAQICQNQGGVPRCACYPGQMVAPDGRNCINGGNPGGDPCLQNNGGCAQICQNQGGAPRCSCYPGQMVAPDGRTCVTGGNQGGGNQGPCSINNGGCAQICQNQGGSAVCACFPGQKLSPDGRTCVSGGCTGTNGCGNNPCNVDNGGCEHICSFVNGASTCRCIQGELGPDGRSCIVNPCQFNNGGCAETCTVFNGQVTCSCMNGVLQPNGKTCASSTGSLVVVGTMPPALALGCQYFVFDASTAFKNAGSSAGRLQYSANGLPSGSGFSISSSLGMFQGTPTAADCMGSQPKPITIKVTDGNAQAESTMYLTSFCERVSTCDQYAPSTRSAKRSIPVIQAEACERLDFNMGQYFDLNAGLFTLDGLPQGTGLSISSMGVIEGIATDADCNASPLQLFVIGTYQDNGPKIQKATVQVVFDSCDCGKSTTQQSLSNYGTPAHYQEMSEDEIISINLKAAKGQSFYYDLTRHLNGADTSDLFFLLSGPKSGTGFKMSKTGVLSGSPQDVDCAPIQAVVTARRMRGVGSPITMSLNIAVDCGNQGGMASFRSASPFVLGSLPPISAFLGEFLHYSVGYHFASPTGLPLEFEVSGIPTESNLYMSKDGVLMGVPSLVDAQLQTILIVARDADDEIATAPVNIILRARQTEEMSPAFIPVMQTLRAFKGLPFSFDIRHRFHGDEDLEFTVNGLPVSSGLKFKNGVLSGEPNDFDLTAQYMDVEITGVNKINGESVGLFSIEVLDITDVQDSVQKEVEQYSTVVGIPIPSQVAIVNKPLVLGVKSIFHDPDGRIQSFSVYGLPVGTGLTMDSQSGIIGGTPNAVDMARPLNLIVRAIDDYGAVASVPLLLQIVSSNDIFVEAVVSEQVEIVERTYPSQHAGLYVVEDTHRVTTVPLVSMVYGTYSAHDFSAYFPSSSGVENKYSIEGLPDSGLAIDDDGILSGVVQSTEQFSHIVMIKATQFVGDEQVGDMHQTVVVDFSEQVENNQNPEAKTLASVYKEGDEQVIIDTSTSFSDPENDELSFFVFGLPEGTGLSMVKSSGVLFGTPSYTDLAASQPLVLTVVAEDSHMGRAQEVMLLGFHELPTTIDESDGMSIEATVKYCHDLNWAFQDGICYDVPKVQGKCVGAMGFQAAEAMCMSVGARLCASEELTATTSVSGACDTSNERVWTSSSCAFDGQVLTQPGFLEAGQPGKLCASQVDAVAKVKCCADDRAVQQHPSSYSVASCQELHWPIPTLSQNKAVCSIDSSEAPDVDVPGKGKAGKGKAGKGKAGKGKAGKGKAGKGKAGKRKAGKRKAGKGDGEDGVCFKKMTYAMASQTCLSMRARICTAEELRQGVGLSSSCKTDEKRVWTSSPCGEENNRVFTQGGSITSLEGDLPQECTSPRSKMSFMCCADFQGKEFSGYAVQVFKQQESKRMASVTFSWPAYELVQVSFKQTDKKLWVTPASTRQVQLTSGSAEVTLSDLTAGFEYAVRITPIDNKERIRDQDVVHYMYLQ